MNPLHESCVCGIFRVKTALLGQFSPTGANRPDCGPLCEQCCRSPWIASLENCIGVERAQTVQTTVVVQAGLFRGQRGITFNTKLVSMSKSRVTSGWLSQPVTSCPPGVDARISRLLQWSSKESMQEVIAWVLGICHAWECSGTIHVGSQCYYEDFAARRHGPMGMRRWKRRACCCMSWWRAHWWNCVRRFVFASRRRWRAVFPGYSFFAALISLGIWTQISLYSGLAARLTEHIRCLHRPGLKDANKPRYRLLRRRLWGVRFFPLAVFPTISQTLAAEAVAMSMEAPMGNAKDAAEERRLRRKEDNAKVRALRRRPSSWGRRNRRPWEIFGVVLLSKNLFQTSPGASRFSFQVRWGWTFFFPLFTLLRYEKNMRIVGLKDFSICLILAGWGCSWRVARKTRTSQTFRAWIRLPRWPRWETMGLANRFPNFLSFPPDSVLHPGFWIISCGFILYHQKEFQCFRCLQSSRVFGMSSENSTRLLVACGAGRSSRVQTHFNARRATRGGCGSSIAKGSFVTCSPKSSGNGMWTRLPKRWCFAACDPCRVSRDCRCGSRQKMSILSVSHVLGRGHLEREFHKEFIPNCMEPCVVSWSLFIKSGRRLRSGRGGQQGVVRGSAGIILVSHLQDKHTWTFRPGLQERDVCTLFSPSRF